MKLVHFSPIPLDYISPSVQSSYPDMKPSGFWVSDEDEDSWSDWCVRNAPDYLSPIPHLVTVDGNILYLRKEEDIDAFTFCYGKNFGSIQAIDWHTVAEEYDGIIITPYQWGKRFEHWYYGWDCASGCIWNPKAITGIQVLQPIK